MSMYSPEVSRTSSQARGPSPLSMTWVSPPFFSGRSKSGKDLLQALVRFFVDVVEERVAVRVDPDPERPEVLDAEEPQALRHELLPIHGLDLLDLGRLQRRGAADDREVDHPVRAHRLDRLVGQAALAADRAHAVVATERLREAHHAGARRRADAERVVAAVVALADIRCGVEEKRTGEIHGRLVALVEDPDLRPVADPDDVPVDGDEVAGAELADVLLRRGEGKAMLGHQASRSKSVEPSASMWAVARRAAQHW